MEKYFLGIIAIVLFFSCKSDTKSTSVNTQWPSIHFDTLPVPDFSVDNGTDFDHDTILVKYNDSITVRHKTVLIDSTLYYIVEGDLLLNEYNYNQYRISILLNKFKPEKTKHVGLVGEMINGSPSRWPENDTITFCINKKTFQNQQQFEVVKNTTLAATNEWMKTCHVVFKYLPEFDNSNLLFGNDKIDFVVLEYNVGGRFIAKSFFPYYPAMERNLIIDPSYFTTSFNKTGIMRHELGHVLGFRHEHILSDAPAACPDEVVEGIIQYTQYDPQSVMHYFCGGLGSRDLEISELDKKGASGLYGLPKK